MGWRGMIIDALEHDHKKTCLIHLCAESVGCLVSDFSDYNWSYTFEHLFLPSFQFVFQIDDRKLLTVLDLQV